MSNNKQNMSTPIEFCPDFYRGEKKGLQILLSYSQAVSVRTAKQEQERISPNHVPTIFHFSVSETQDYSTAK